MKLSAFSHCPPIFEGVDRGVGFSPLPPLISPSPPPPTPLSPSSLLGAVRAKRAQNSLPQASPFFPSRPLFSLLPPPLLPPPAPSRPSSPTSPLPCPPPHISLACSKTVQRTITLTYSHFGTISQLTEGAALCSAFPVKAEWNVAADVWEIDFGKVYFIYHCAVCFNTTILWVL